MAYLGGLDRALIADLAMALRGATVAVETDNHPYPGTHHKNICNRTSTGRGAQFELTMPFRNGRDRAAFVDAVRSVLLSR